MVKSVADGDAPHLAIGIHAKPPGNINYNDNNQIQ